MDPEIEAALSRLADLSDEELAALDSQLTDAFETADKANDETVLTALADAIELVRAEVEQRNPAEEAEPVAAAVATTETPAGPATTASAPQEGTPVTSSTLTVPRDAEPVVTTSGSRVFVGGDVPGFTAGAELTSSKDFSDAMMRRIDRVSKGVGSDGEQVVVASIVADRAPERELTGDSLSNLRKIQEVIDPDAITAAGGCCAPLETRYDLFDCGGVTDRPVKAALANFRADRGGIRFFRGPSLADVAGANGFWTCADDAAATVEDPTTWKVCSRIDCPPEETAELQAITQCMTFGVLQSRVFPELVTANQRLALVAQARLAESALLAQLRLGSTRLNDAGTPLGAARDLLTTVGRAAMYMRDRYRIKDAPLRAILPTWLPEVLRGDHILGPDYGGNSRAHYGITDAEIEGWFADRKINVTWTMDSAYPGVRGGGFFDKITWTPGDLNGAGETPGVLPAFPSTVEWALYPEGTWLHLDGGQLDLGVIRDSSLARTNDYQTFSEFWESAANIGCESFWITSQINVSGLNACCI